MAVQIPISANASSVRQAFKEIQDAIDRAGQSGRKFVDLDFSHPELSGMADEIRKVQGRIDDMARMSRGATAAAVRSFYDGSGVNLFGPGGLLSGGLDRRYPNPADASRVINQAGVPAFQGTRWQQPPPGTAVQPGPPAPPTPPGAGGAGGGMLAGLGSSMMGFMGASLALAGISTIKQVLSESIGKAQQEAGTDEDLYRRTDMSQNFNALRDSVMAVTKGLGVTAQEAGQLALHFAKITGETDPQTIAASTRFGIGFGRSYGMDPGSAVAGLAQASNAGIDPRTFATLVGEAVGKGGRSIDETMSAMNRIAEASASAFLGKLGTNLTQSGGMYAGLMGMSDQFPGMRNGGAERIMGALTGSLTNPGAGPAGQAFMYMAGQRQQGVSDPYRQQFLREGGLFASPASAGVGTSGVSNFESIRAEMSRQFPGTDLDSRLRRYNAMENLVPGLNMRQIAALDQYHPADLTTTFGALSKSGLDVSQLSETGIAGAVRAANASPADLDAQRQEMLRRHGQGALSTADQATLSAAGPKELRDVMLQMVAKYGQQETEGSKTRDSQAELSNAMTKIGRDLLPPLNDLKDGMATLGGGLADLGSIITDVYRAGRGDRDASDRLTYGKGPEAAGRARGDRDNNPLNLKGAGDAGLDGEFGKYSTPEAGIAAAQRQLLKYQDRDHLMTLSQMIGKWAPPGDHNDTEGYIKQVAGETGIDANKPIDMHDPAIAARVINAMTHREVGHPLEPDMIDRGVSRGLGGSASSAPQSHSITVAPLEVFHFDNSGRTLLNEQLPFTRISPPTPSGLPPPDGDGSLFPGALPINRNLDAYYLSHGRQQSDSLDLNLTPKPDASYRTRQSNNAWKAGPSSLPEQIPTEMPKDLNYSSPAGHARQTGVRT